MTTPQRAARLSQGAFRFVEAELARYPETLARVEARRRELIEQGQGVALDEQSHTRQGSTAWADPTGRRGVLLAGDRQLQEMARVASAIGAVLALLLPERRRVIELRYWGQPGARWETIAGLAGISEKTCRLWRTEAILAVADRLGLW